MDISEKSFQFMKRKFRNVDDILQQLCDSINGSFFIRQKRVEELRPLYEQSKFSDSKRRDYESRLVSYNAEYYKEIGRFLFDFGILESLTKRSNANFKKVGAPFLSMNLEQALEEFNFQKNNRTTNPVLAIKIAFYINKITKYLDDIEYGDMLNSDESNSKVGMHNRLKFLSKLKTEYLKKVFEANQNLSTDNNKVQIGSQEEYERLFGEFFDNLDFKADYDKIEMYEIRKMLLYAHKGNILNQGLAMLITTPPNKVFDRDIKSWGFYKDENNKIVFGCNLYSYPMPITIHMQKTFLVQLFNCDTFQFLRGRVKLPKYKNLFTPDGGVFTTNILFQTNESQRSRIREAASRDKSNPCLSFFLEQIKDRTPNINREDGFIVDELL